MSNRSGSQIKMAEQLLSPPGPIMKVESHTPGHSDMAVNKATMKPTSSEISQRGTRFTTSPSDRLSRTDDNLTSIVERKELRSMQPSGVNTVAAESANEPSNDQPEGPGLHKEKKFSGRCRLFVGNLPNDMTDTEFRKMFEPYGELNEVFLNSGRGFGFIRLDTRHHAEDARAALDGVVCRGRHLRVRFAAHAAALRVKYLSSHISNEVLYEAFSMFGELERAVVVVDDRGKPTGEGIVEFARKAGAMTALKRITEGVFLMTANPRPIAVEMLEQTDENDGLPEVFVLKSQELAKEREQPPRFAQPGSFEYEFGLKWKTLYQMLQEQQELLKKNFEEEVAKMELDMDAALMEQHTAMLRQDLMRRQEELRRLEEQTQIEIQRRLEIRRQQEEERRRQNMDILEMRRHDEMLWRQQQKQEEEMYSSTMERQLRVDRTGMQPGTDRGLQSAIMQQRTERGGATPLMQRTERVGLAPPMQPPPVPPTVLGMERPRLSGTVGGVNAAGIALPAGGPVSSVDKTVPPLMIQQQLPRSRYEHPHQSMVTPGGNMGGDNPRMAAPSDEYFDPKRMRRY